MWPTGVCTVHGLTRHTLAGQPVPHACTDAHQVIDATQGIADVAGDARVDVHFKWTHFRRIRNDPVSRIQFVTACNVCGAFAHGTSPIRHTGTS
jgi:hypothetical protein